MWGMYGSALWEPPGVDNMVLEEPDRPTAARFDRQAHRLCIAATIRQRDDSVDAFVRERARRGRAHALAALERSVHLLGGIEHLVP